MEIDLDILDTEKINANSLNIDKLGTLDILKLINDEDKTIAKAVEKQLDNIQLAVDKIYKKLKNGGRLIYIGAGTSGRLGVLDAVECSPTYGVEDTFVQGIIAGGNDAMFKAKEGAEDSKELAYEDLKKVQLNENDAIVGIAASGRTPYVIGALGYAKTIGATTVSICCVKNGAISKLSEVAIEVLVGPEVVTGSTRMKSGTAQKMILNMISTTVMIKLGKVYRNLMIDVKATNEKLVERAKSIIIDCTSCTREQAEKAFIESNKDVKVAIFMILSNNNMEESVMILNKNNGRIRDALGTVKQLSS
ncbi:N-acetylmuramic acid 6-phosphate etherase [Clostridium vincentii]|uniref:N-acetylmuramic acid 6-phosphate etherase n=1 Tax=Clostridium vincentii TaxID=52704 RepID=A0A2T0BD80_9CLOT|nr:N-acetylmuramic acid 6-phosphate etherase [Clostridium vincentii]PRR81792.1 N-acetylmuramic acid 6-phosphate etherase [Clostridium vincentii]